MGCCNPCGDLESCLAYIGSVITGVDKSDDGSIVFTLTNISTGDLSAMTIPPPDCPECDCPPGLAAAEWTTDCGIKFTLTDGTTIDLPPCDSSGGATSCTGVTCTSITQVATCTGVNCTSVTQI